MLLRQHDKLVFSSAAVFGMLTDLHLSTPVPGTKLVSTKRYFTAYVHSYSLVHFSLTYTLIIHIVNRTAAFYWGYLIGVLPIALHLRRLPVAKIPSCFIFLSIPMLHLQRQDVD
jgi:hypothetical protein